jgi:hypothetical protein
MPTGRTYDWKRFWCPRNGAINLIDGGYLADPDASYGGYLNPALRTFRDISWLPCLALLGEPDIGKTEAMKADQAAVDAAVGAEDGKTLRLDLRSCGSEQRLVDKLFGDPRFASWMEGNHRLHVFLDSLDECLLRIDTVAAPDEEDVLLSTLAGGTEFVGEDEFPVDKVAVREALRSGLLSARGPERLGWAHQTYAEFLAARYLVRRGVANENVMALLVHPEDEEDRLALQLHEAAAWLAGMSIEVFREFTERDPEVLLRSDVASADAEGKAALVGTLLRLYDEERLLDVGMAPRNRYKRMIHPGIAEQLRPYIVDGDKSLSARRVALDIAEACELRFLQEDAAAVSLGTDEDLLVRKEAAHIVAVAGDDPTRARLMPLAAGEAGEDPNDDLKGNGLRAVWPEHVAAEELFGILTRPKIANYMGSYRAFLTYDLADSLSTADLPAALAWVDGRDPDDEEPLRFNELADQIMQRAWAELPNPDIAQAFAKAALARLRCNEEVVKERREVFEATAEPTFGERVAAAVRRRPLLLQELIGLLETEHDAFYVVRWKTPLITREDVGWLVEMLRSEASEQRKAIIATLVAQAQWLWDDESEEQVYLAHLEDQTLAGKVAGIFSPVELGSEEADEQRRLHERLS